MGNCPSGYEAGMFGTCRITCPDGFKNAQEGNPPIQKCVSNLRNDRFVLVNSIGAIQDTRRPIPPAYAAETARFNKELAALKVQMDADEKAAKLLSDAGAQRSDLTHQYGRIQSEYASFNGEAQNVNRVKEVADSLKPFRPPTSPASDLEAERRKITEFQARSLLFIQVALAIVVLVLVSYLIMPADYANAIAFLLLCVAISFGFFLRR